MRNLRTLLLLLVIASLGCLVGCKKDQPAPKPAAQPTAQGGGCCPDHPADAKTTEKTATPTAAKEEPKKEEAPKVVPPNVQLDPAHKPKLLVTLPDDCNTPDGCCLDKAGNIILSVPNYNDPTKYSRLLKIDPQNKVTEFLKLPVHPVTKIVRPMGIAMGPDGHLYLADNQYFAEPMAEPNFRSRLLKIVLKADGSPTGEVVTVVDGFRVANAVCFKGDEVFVSDTCFEYKEPEPMPSGIYRFKLSEFGDKPVVLQRDYKDPHLAATITTKGKTKFGADGLCFDAKGNLYCGNFGDGILHKITFAPDGKTTVTNFATAPHMACCDGIFFDAKSNTIFVADSVYNAVQAVDPETGKVTTVWTNGDVTGEDGQLDQPCEVIVRGRELIAVNMDWPFPGLINLKHEPPFTLSVIQLK